MKLYRFKTDHVFDPDAASVSVRKNGLYFNTAATSCLELSKCKTITIDYDHEDPKCARYLYVSASIDGKSVSNLHITKSGKDNIRAENQHARFVACQQLIDRFPSLKFLSNIKRGGRGASKLSAEYDTLSKCLKILLVPKLENSSYDVSTLPEVGAVYCYMQGNEKVYIGQTNNLNRRARQHAQNKWQFDQIRFSYMDNDVDRLKWEKHFLDHYINQNGSLPRFNLIGGVNKDSSPQLLTAVGGEL